MKKATKLLFAGALLAAASVPLAASAAVYVDVNVGFPGYSTYVAPAPVYYPPRVVYAAPRPYYYRDFHDRRWDREWERHHRFDGRRW